MSASALSARPASDQDVQLVDLMEAVIVADSLEELEESLLPLVGRFTHSTLVGLYLADPLLAAPQFLQRGLGSEAVPAVEGVFAEQFDRIAGLTTSDPVSVDVGLVLYPLQADQTCVGLLGLGPHDDRVLEGNEELERVPSLLAQGINRLVERMQSQKELSDLNTYLTVSSMLAQSLDLRELLEMVLYCCMEAVSAESASVLLLDDEKLNFQFYQVEGPAKPVLAAATFPADKGLAGSVLRGQQSEIIHDVQSDPRFYGDIDSDTGVQTRNMIVIPLTAGEEKVGVLEVLNKADGGSFSETEHLLLVSIAEEIAFAIRNALVFDYVVNTYCLQRQGQSCRGCKRPLGSWTPCVKYQEVGV
ncbi:GAF domain-containing protein [Chloroflexota bacterium]